MAVGPPHLWTGFYAVFPDQYTIGVRALDDFGNPSAPLVAHWNFPAGSVPLPSQLDHGAIVPATGTWPDIAAQEVTFAATTTIRAAYLWTAPGRGAYYYSQTSLSVYQDQGGSRGDEIPSGSSTAVRGMFDVGGEQEYTFPSLVTFSPGSYWFVLSEVPSCSPTLVYGSADGNIYFRFGQAMGP